MEKEKYRHSEETKRKISEAQKKRYANMTPAQEEKRIKAIKKKWGKDKRSP